MTLVVTNTTNLELALQPDSNFWQDSARTTSASATDPVGAWDDQSGNSNHATQGTTANKPTLGSDQVEGDGSSDFLIADAAAVADDVTIYLVLNFDTIVNGDYIISLSNSDKSEELYLFWFGTTQLRWIVATDTQTRTTSQSITSTTGLGLVTLQFDQTNSTQKIFTPEGDGSTGVGGSTANVDLLTLFARRDDSTVSNHSAMPIIACYVYSVAHNDTDRGTIEDELTAEYIDTTQTASPNAIAVTATVQQPSVIGPDQTTSPNAIAVTATVQQPSVIGPDQTTSPNAIAVTATVEQPTVTTGAVTANPDSIAITATVEQPSVTSIVTASPDSITVTATVEEPTAIGPDQTASPDAITVTATVEQPTVSTAGSLQTVSPNAIAITATVEQPTVTSIVTASPNTIAITATVEEPSVTTGAVTVSPDTIAITATVQQPSVIGPMQTASPNAIAITATVEQPTVTNIVQGEVYSGSIAVSYPYAGAMAVTYPYSGTIEVA